jgi:putative tricarboxylic transport membrane protein
MILAFGNVGSSILMLAVSKSLIYVTRVPGHVLAPILLVLVCIGTYASQNDPNDVLFVFIFGVLGVVMERLDYNRPALLLGFVLGETIERYLQISLNAYGDLFFLRPISLTIIALAAACIFWPRRRLLTRLWRRA